MFGSFFSVIVSEMTVRSKTALGQEFWTLGSAYLFLTETYISLYIFLWEGYFLFGETSCI